MGAEIEAWAWGQECKPATKLVLLALADHANGEGDCWLYNGYIARKVGMTRRMIQLHLAVLIEKGFIVRQERYDPKSGQLSNCYSLQYKTKNLRKNIGGDEIHFTPPMKSISPPPMKSISPLISNISNIEIDNSKEIRKENKGSKKQFSLSKNKEKTKKREEAIFYGEFSHVRLLPGEREKLAARLGEEKTARLIRALDLGIGSKGYKYVDHYKTILNWAEREEDRKKELNKTREVELEKSREANEWIAGLVK